MSVQCLSGCYLKYTCDRCGTVARRHDRLGPPPGWDAAPIPDGEQHLCAPCLRELGQAARTCQGA